MQGLVSDLTDFAVFERSYFVPGSVHHPRFLGSRILFELAQWIGSAVHSTDVRLHPLRIAAGVLTPLYAVIGAWPSLRSSSSLDWRAFLVPYSVALLIGLYVFYPGDMPALALLSLALYCVLIERFWLALVTMLITGLFRESALHVVVFVAAWAWCAHSRPLAERLMWTGVFAVAFVAEYVFVRQFFPGPVSSVGGFNLDPHFLFLDRGMLSLTTLCSLGLAVVFPLACLLRYRGPNALRTDWRTDFFRLNCVGFIAWVVFYRSLNGNMSEFRLLWPALLPCIYGLAWRARPAAADRPNPRGRSLAID